MNTRVGHLNQFVKVLESGIANIANHYLEINKTNYFPINDGDTGTNLKTSLLTAFKKVKINDSSTQILFLEQFSEELFLNAIGNSGIIFAQAMSGFLRGYKAAQARHANSYTQKHIIARLMSGWKHAVDSVYQIFSNSQEGTILTLIRESYKHACLLLEQQPHMTIVELIEKIYLFCKTTLPLLPAMFKKPVEHELHKHIDAGALGFYYFLEGVYLYLCQNKKINYIACMKDEHQTLSTSEIVKTLLQHNDYDFSENAVGYCNEHIMQTREQYLGGDVECELRRQLERIGASSIAVFKKEHLSLVKIHCHHHESARVLAICEAIGPILKSKIENMTLQKHIFNQKDNISTTHGEQITKEGSNNIICFSSASSWSDDLQQLKLFHYTSTPLEAQQQFSESLVKRIKNSNDKFFFVLLHQQKSSKRKEMLTWVEQIFREATKQYQILNLKYSYECYITAANLLLDSSKQCNPIAPAITYNDQLWAQDNLVIYLVPNDGKINIVRNGKLIGKCDRILDLKIASFIPISHGVSVEDFDEVVISAESDATVTDTVFLQKLFSDESSDFDVGLRSGNELKVAYTIIIS